MKINKLLLQTNKHVINNKLFCLSGLLGCDSELLSKWFRRFRRKLLNIFIFDVHVAVHRDKFRKIKPTRCTDFSNLFLE